MLSQDENSKLLIDIAQRLSSIEGKLSALDSIDNSIETIRDTANRANARADTAYNYAKENDKNIDRLAQTIKWTVGTVITVLIPVIGGVLTLLFM